jgi:hypothetical protein
MSHEEKIKHCHNQEAMRIVDKANYSIHNIFATPDIEMFQGSKENFIQDAKKKALSTHAVLTKNGWYEIEQRGTSIKTTVRGKIVERWGKVCNDLIDSASDDTLLTVCTCHI